VKTNDSRCSPALWLIVVLLAGATVYGRLIFAPSLTWDDDTNIFANPHFLSGEWAIFWKEPYFGLYIPITSWIWGAVYNLGQGSAVPFRVLNLVLHLVNSFAVFLLLRGLAARWTLPAVSVLIGTTIFALHPLQVNTVAWLSGGRDLLASFFALLCLCVYFGNRTPGGETSYSRFALATALFLASTLCKPSTAVLPLVVLGVELLLEGTVRKMTALYLSLWTFFGGAIAWLTHLAQGPYDEATFSIFDRTLVVLDTYSFYLQKFVAPFELSANYGRTPESALASGTIVASVVMTIAVLAGFSFLSWKRDHRYLLILTWFAAMLPVSGVWPFAYQRVSTVSDHYNYLPMALLAATTAFVLSRVHWDRLAKPVAHAVMAILVLMLSTLSWNRAQAWTNDVEFFTDMSQHSPESYATALGMSIVMCEDLQQFEDGIKWTEAALKAKPLDILALANQAFCFLHARNYFRVIELEYYLGQLDIEEIEQNQPTAYSSLLASIGTAYIEQQEYEDGFEFLCEAFRVNPGDNGHSANLNVAKDLLRSKGIEPTCEQVQVEGEDENPIQEIWPNFEPSSDEAED
jgi:protein O-mannosyl-transferase